MTNPGLLLRRISRLSFALAILAITSGAGTSRAAERPLYLDPGQPLEARVDDLLGRMTLEEKILLLHADSKFTTAAIPRLGIPRRWLSDGPHGVREDIGPDTWTPAGRTDDFATCMPCGIALAAAWNPDLAQSAGGVIGEEALARGKQIMLGPAVNIMRTPLCGRNFEYFGEDPFLTSRIAVGYIRGEQSKDVASCVKHFAANNQETERGTIDVEMDERTLREIYLPSFKAAVQEAGVWTVMGAYNKFRGQHCCHNDYLLNKILKGEWGFNGLVVSDWAGAHDTREAALNGLDLEMGTERAYNDFYLASPFLEGLRTNAFPMSVLDDKVRRNLRVMIATHVLDGRPPGAINTKEHQATARRVAEEAMVLLKNEGGALPLDPNKIKTLAVIGENATRPQTHGGQSSEIKAFYEILPLDGILQRVGRQVNVTYAIGYDAPPGDRRSTRPRNGIDPLPAAVLSDRAVDAARAADAVIFIGGLNHDLGFDCESRDRKDMKLPYGQDDLLARVLEANPHTVVVLVSGSPVEMSPWLERAPAVLQAWYSGMEGGNALARILFGDVNPSGKLPCTFPRRLEDSPAHNLHAYPGTNGVVRYEEGLLVGYRWFDTKQIEPLFPFGHGLSYTSFDYSALHLAESAGTNGPTVNVEFELSNTGGREGAEVAQVYVQDLQSALPRPLKELKGFKKVSLKPGVKQTVSIPLDRSAFAYYDPEKKGWVAEAGEFKILVGSSSRDIRLEGNFRLAQTTIQK
jgi:beta-glucosidase